MNKWFYLKTILLFLLSMHALSSPMLAYAEGKKIDFQTALNIKRLPPISTSEAMDAFGASVLPNGKLSFRTIPEISRTNLLNHYDPNKMTQELKSYLIKSSLCGERKFQLIYTPYKQKGQTISVSYACDSSCLASYELHESDPLTKIQKLTAMSDPISLPLTFCESLWGGVVKITSDEKDK